MKNLILFTALLGTAVCQANDVTEWRGESRRGVFDKEKNLVKEFKREGLPMLWVNEELGDSYASVTIVDDKIFTTGITRYDTEEDNPKVEGKKLQDYDGKEYLHALNKKDGKLLWSTHIGESNAGKDPRGRKFPPARSTPTYADGHLYVVTGAGDVSCVTPDGKIVWQANIVKDFGGVPSQGGDWGWSISPVVHDGKVIFTIASAEGAMIALDTKTGKKVWLSDPLSGKAAYASPNLIEKKGKKQIVGMNEDWMFGVDPATGKVEWKFGLKQLEDLGEGAAKGHFYIWCVTPVLEGDMVVSTGGYNIGTFAVKVNDTLTEAEFAWIVPNLDTRHLHPVIADGTAWVVSAQKPRIGAIDIKTGEVLWSAEGPKGASLTAADGMLYCFGEWRTVSLIEMSKKEYVPKGQFGLRHGSMKDSPSCNWSHPVICDGILYARNGNALIAYDVRK